VGLGPARSLPLSSVSAGDRWSRTSSMTWGTDLFAQARDARRFDRGLFVGVQVKVGPSYFAQPAHTEDGSLRCQPPRSFWIRAKQYAPGPITCGVCGQDFQPQDAGRQ
jgi:hypothetical protein